MAEHVLALRSHFFCCALACRAHVVLASHPGANDAFASRRIFRLRSADRRHGLKGTAGHWRPFRYRAWLRRTAARVRQPRERAMARFSPPENTGPNWDSNTDLLDLAKF